MFDKHISDLEKAPTHAIYKVTKGSGQKMNVQQLTRYLCSTGRTTLDVKIHEIRSRKGTSPNALT